MTETDPVVPTGPTQPSLELVLANQANDAMRRGADPHATTDMLGVMLKHIRANPDLAAHGADALARGADPGQVAHKVWEMAQAAQPAPQGGLGSRIADQIGGSLKQIVMHPLDTVAGIVEAPVRSLTAAMAPSVGANRTSASLSKGGNSSGRPIDTSPYDAEHGGVTGKERLIGAAQTAVNIGLPGVIGGVTSKLGTLAGASTGGALAGAAYTPEDPIAGAAAGAIMAPALGAAAKGAGKVGGRVGSTIVDVAGRPSESRPLIQAGPIQVGNIEGLSDRAARLNASGLERAGFFTSAPENWRPNDKPIAPADLGTQPQRMLRGLKTASPAAETQIRADLEPRTEGTVERVIGQAKELTGIKRTDAFETHEALKARTSAEGDASYGKVWGTNQGGAITDPARLAEIDRLRSTPSGGQAWKVAQKMMANDGVETNAGPPSGFSPEQWAQVQKVATEKGIPLPGVAGPTTLKQLHYWKLALDDLKQPGLNQGEGAGGIGYNMGRSIHGVQKQLLSVMDAENPGYAEARSQFADNKSLEKASELGAEHWTRDPAEATALLRDMSPAEQKIYRDNAFDKWATRVENGPENVGKGQSKSLNQKRLRLLFPDDASFATFKAGLQHEATMYTTEKAVLGGSNTADKLADMAHDAGVTVPEILSAAGGHFMPIVRGVATRTARAFGNANTDRLNVERAKLLTAGAGGDASARLGALRKMGNYQTQPAGATKAAASALAPLPEALDSRKGPDLYPPSNAAQAVRQQVDALNQKETVRAHKPKRRY